MTRVLQKMKFREKRKCFHREGLVLKKIVLRRAGHWKRIIWAFSREQSTCWTHWEPTHSLGLSGSLNQRRGTEYSDWPLHVCVCVCMCDMCICASICLSSWESACGLQRSWSEGDRPWPLGLSLLGLLSVVLMLCNQPLRQQDARDWLLGHWNSL